MGCRITLFFVANCEAFEVIGTSGPAQINGLLNAYSGPQAGKIYSLQLQQGEVIEIQSSGTSLNINNNAPQVLIAFIGQATGGDATHLTDTNRNWPIGWFKTNSIGFNKRNNLVILSGAGAGKVTAITDNTADTLTFDAVVGLVPDSSSQYAIVWNLGNRVSNGSIVPVVFVVPETGAYTVEVTAPLGFDHIGPDPFGRATYFLQKSELNKPAVPITNAVSATYDSTRDCVWVLDHSGIYTTDDLYLVAVSPDGLTLSRTNLGTLGQCVVVYCPVNDRLALADTNGNLIIVDPSTKTVESTTALVMSGFGGEGSEYLGAFCPSNNYVYFPDGTVVDPVAKTLVTVIAAMRFYMPIFMPADNNIWYVPAFNRNANPLEVIDPATNIKIHDVAVIANFMGGQLAYVPSTGKVYGPSTSYPGALAVYDPLTYTILRNTLLDTSINLTGLVYRSQDGFLYAGTSCQGTDGAELCSLVKIDPATESIVERWLCPPQPQVFHVSSSGNIVITGFGNASFSILPYDCQNSAIAHIP